MVRECRPAAREASRFWLTRLSTMATSTPPTPSRRPTSGGSDLSGDHHTMLVHGDAPVGSTFLATGQRHTDTGPQILGKSPRQQHAHLSRGSFSASAALRRRTMRHHLGLAARAPVECRFEVERAGRGAAPTLTVGQRSGVRPSTGGGTNTFLASIIASLPVQ
jgi:hypothetical protein